MKTCSLAAGASMLGLAFVMSTNAHAADLQVLAGGGIAAPLKELGPQFEGTSGRKPVFRFGTTPELIKLATSSDPFDVGVVPAEVLKDAGAQARFASGPTVVIARVGLGVAVRAGAPKPDISTPDALKQALLKAKSIATVPASAAGAQVLRVFGNLGIADELKAKTQALPGPAQVVQAVANGDADLGVFLVNILTAPGLDVVGPFPAAVQQEVVFTAAVAAKPSDAAAAKAFIDFLRTPSSVSLIKARGMIPG